MLGIPVDFISIERPEVEGPTAATGQIPAGESGVMHRGRAAAKLSRCVAKTPWHRFTACPFEDLREPERVHVDPLGYVHICQGISLGNVFRSSLEQICADYVAEEHPITGPLLEGGPAALARRFEIPHDASYADACHLCYETRRALRDRFPRSSRRTRSTGRRTPAERPSWKPFRRRRANPFMGACSSAARSPSESLTRRRRSRILGIAS